MAQSVFPNRNYTEYPIHTTASRISTTGLPTGYTAYNETSKKLEIWNGTIWYGFDENFASGVMPWAGDVFTFTGGAMNISTSSIAVAGKSMANGSAVGVTAGGTLTINGAALGSYDYVIKSGDQTVSSFSNGDFFTTTADTRSAFVVVQGNLTINSGQTFIPSNRKLFTCIYVTGNLSVGGTISMSARGSNHSGTGSSGGATTAAAIRIVTGTHTSVVNPEVPAAGGAAVATNLTGTAGTGGGTGGGAGGVNDNTAATAGTAGTSFTGGSGGGGGRTYGGIGTPNAGAAGVSNGGAGGAALPAGGPYPSANPSSGGSGNPGGAGGENPGGDGTGGVLFIIVEGTISGAGTIAANGVASGAASERRGGGSGGGSVTILYTTDSSTITPTATGGGGGYTGGAGTARKLAIA